MALEQQNAKVFLESPNPCADARLVNTKSLGRMSEVQIFGNSKRLD
jgi:hypothetical protein